MIDKLAGRLRMDPGPYTLRELVAMDRARAMEDWNHTAAICSTIAMALGKPVPFDAFHPLLSAKRADEDGGPEIEIPFDTFLLHATGER